REPRHLRLVVGFGFVGFGVVGCCGSPQLENGISGWVATLPEVVDVVPLDVLPIGPKYPALSCWSSHCAGLPTPPMPRLAFRPPPWNPRHDIMPARFIRSANPPFNKSAVCAACVALFCESAVPVATAFRLPPNAPACVARSST